MYFDRDYYLFLLEIQNFLNHAVGSGLINYEIIKVNEHYFQFSPLLYF